MSYQLLNLQWCLNYQLPAERTVAHWTTSTRILYYQLLAECTEVHWATSYQLKLQRYIELPVISWIYSGTWASSWRYSGTLNYQFPAEFTVVHWTTSFSLKTHWYIEEPTTSYIYSGTLSLLLQVEFTVVWWTTSWIFSGTLSYLLPDEFTEVHELPASSSIKSVTLSNQQATELTNVHWFTNFQLN